MVAKFIILFLSIISILGIISLYALKIAYQYQYLRLKNGLKNTDLFEAWSFSLTDARSKKLRKEAIMLFPLFFPIDLDEKSEELNKLKRIIKKLHIFIYLFIMLALLLGVYTSKAYPNGMFSV